MALDIVRLERVFELKDGNKIVKLKDPNNQFTATEVGKFYAGQYPQLTTSTVDGPKVKNDQMVYTFATTVGTKG